HAGGLRRVRRRIRLACRPPRAHERGEPASRHSARAGLVVGGGAHGAGRGGSAHRPSRERACLRRQARIASIWSGVLAPAAIVALALAAVFLLIFLHVPIGIAMTVVGVAGFAIFSGWNAALTLLSTEPASLLGNIDIAVIPLFLLMGALANISGIADDTYDF